MAEKVQWTQFPHSQLLRVFLYIYHELLVQYEFFEDISHQYIELCFTNSKLDSYFSLSINYYFILRSCFQYRNS